MVLTQALHCTHPLHLPEAVLARPVEVTGGAVLIRDNGRGLEAVGEDDVWVHGRNIQVVDQGSLLPVIMTIDMGTTKGQVMRTRTGCKDACCAALEGYTIRVSVSSTQCPFLYPRTAKAGTPTV